mmetsp:Transcript_15003/g.40466  ORF Transcript_15003/g.40466 Transcript_15003/m.40466 type:complete len:533 (+) Transcript_15003:2899-4497(+)
MVLAPWLGLDEAVVLQLRQRLLREALDPEALCLALKVCQGHATNAAHRAAEAGVHHVAAQPIGLKDLCTVVALQQADAHLGQDLHDTLLQALLQVLLGIHDADVGHLARLDQRLGTGAEAPLASSLVCEVGADGVSAVANEGGRVVGGIAGQGVNHDGGIRAQALADEVMVHSADCQQGRNGRALGVHACRVSPVGQHHTLAASLHCRLHLCAQRRDGRRQAALLSALEGQPEQLGAQVLIVDDGAELRLQQDGALKSNLAVGVGVGLEQVATLAQAHLHAHDQALTQGIDGGVRHLGKALLEVVVQGVGLVGEHSQRDVITHAVGGLIACLSHRLHDHLCILSTQTAGTLQPQQRGRIHGGVCQEVGLAQVRQSAQAGLQHLLVRQPAGNLAADLRILHECAALKVSHHHLARTQAPLGHNLLRVAQHIVQHTDLGRNIDEVVLGLPEARRAQAVAVQARAHLLAIAEHQQGGSVPALLNALPVLVKVGCLRVSLHQVRVVAVCLRHECHESLGRLHTSAHHDLSHAVQVG